MIEFSPEYGVMVDTLAALEYQCNPDQEGRVRQQYGLGQEGTQWIESHFDAPDEGLDIFFSLCDNRKDPFIRYFQIINGDEMLPCTIQEYSKKYFTVQQLQKALVEYYLIVDYNSCSMSNLREGISKSSYSTDMKYHLTSFLLDPEYYVDLLNVHISSYANKVREYHQKHSYEIHEVMESLDESALNYIDESVLNDSRKERRYRSITLLAEYFFERRGLGMVEDNERVLFSVGPRWKEKLQQYLSHNDVNILSFGKIISEENRIKIIQYLLAHEEITIAEAVRYLKTSVTATNYHLNMMADAKMLRVRNEGRKLFYSLNREYFDNASYSIKNVADQINIPDILAKGGFRE